MQTSIIFSIIRKDLHANRGWFAAYLALSSFAAVFEPLVGSEWISKLQGDIGTNLPAPDLVTITVAIILSLLGGLVLVPRVVLADSPAKESPFWVTRPISRSTLFLAKALLIFGSLVVIPQLPAILAQCLAGFPWSEVFPTMGFMLLSSTLSYAFMFAICSMTKSTKSYIGWMVLVLAGFSVLSSVVFLASISRFLWTADWPEMSGIYAALIAKGSLGKLMFLPMLVSTLGMLGVAYHQYVRRKTFHSIGLFSSLLVLTCLLYVLTLDQAISLPAAKQAAKTIPADALELKLTEFYPSRREVKPAKEGVSVSRTPEMIGKFLVSDWPEDVHAIAISNAAFSFDLQGRREAVVVPPKERMALYNGLPVVSIHEPGQGVFLKRRGDDGKVTGSWFSRSRDVMTKEPFWIPFAWPPPGLASGLPSEAKELTLTLDLAVFRHETRGVLPLRKGASARCGDRLVSILGVTPSPRQRQVKVEIEEKHLLNFDNLGLGVPLYRLKQLGTASLGGEASRELSTEMSWSMITRRHLELTFQSQPGEELSEARPPQDQGSREHLATSLKEAELVISEIVPAGTIQRQIVLNDQQRLRVMYASRPGSHRPDHAKLVHEDVSGIPADRRSLVGIGFLRLILDTGSALSEPTLKVHVPETMRGEFDALPDDKARFSWLAKQVRSQMADGDLRSADGYATLLLHGLGVERNLPEAKRLLRDAITRHDFASARKYVELRMLDPDQPDGVRDSMELIIPLLEADHLGILWSTQEAMDILAASPSDADHDLERQLVSAIGHAIRRAFSEPSTLRSPAKNRVDESAPKVLARLIQFESPEAINLAERIVEAWLTHEPQNATALLYQKSLKAL